MMWFMLVFALLVVVLTLTVERLVRALIVEMREPSDVLALLTVGYWRRRIDCAKRGETLRSPL
jgi:hypothetical protein